MGIWKQSLDEANNGPVIGQSVQYSDRDTPQQLELPFENPKDNQGTQKKTAFEVKRELDERFENLNTVLTGRDVDVSQKRQVLVTLLNNFKTGNPDISNRSGSLILDTFVRLLG